tara:strand:+ start:496 stop:789 length:294 start_codon:yes stop_codon:yes gene_type:complete
MNFVRKEPHVNSNNEVVIVKIGATEVDGDYSAQIEKLCFIAEEDQKPLTDWTEADVVSLYNSTSSEEDWQTILNADIEAQKNKPSGTFFPGEREWSI